jgi:LmbE family N-acetylglucosaminyl deacetylase
MSRLLLGLLAAAGLGTHLFAQTPPVPAGSGAILQEMAAFRQTGTVLYVAAHPDDEDTQLIAYFARGRGYRTGYLSLTRGEGGQDLIGPQLGDELGVIRTQELLAARRVDGGQQFFSRARDFGFSKDYRQTLQRWDRQQVLSDVVRVIRTFRPDVMITRFPPQASETHGHHTASSVLAIEAFKLAGDPAAFPEQQLPAWQPKRIIWDATRPGFQPGPTEGTTSQIEIGGFNPLLGLSFGEVAALSRSNHRSQGFGAIGTRGSRFAYFEPLGGSPPPADPFGDIDTSWNRYVHGEAVGDAAAAVMAGFDAFKPEQSVPALLDLRAKLLSLAPAHPGDPVIRDRLAQLDRILQACVGLYVEATSRSPSVVPGETLAVKLTAISRSNVPVLWNGAALPPNQPVSVSATLAIPAAQPPSQPYWLQLPEDPGMFHVADPTLIGRPESPPDLVMPPQTFTVGGQSLVLHLIPTQVTADPARGEIRVPVKVIPPVSLAFAHEVALFAPGSTHAVSLIVTAERAPVSGVVGWSATSGRASNNWRAGPSQPFTLTRPGQKVAVTLELTAPATPEATDLSATATVNGAPYNNQRIEIRYDHIPFQLLQPPVVLHVASLELNNRAQRIGYLPGAGDTVADCLTQMGCAVTFLTGEDLTPEKLRNFDAVVVGVRAFNVRSDLAAHVDGLFAYVAAGGTVVEQYNTPNELRVERLGPYPMALDRNLPHHRITNEKSPVTFLSADHPALTGPNRIQSSDFDGWVQERGLNFPASWDKNYLPLLSTSDPEEPPKTSAVLVAHYGQGYFVYTGLSFFRQLPAGVPGAYRLFANLISLGK